MQQNQRQDIASSTRPRGDQIYRSKPQIGDSFDCTESNFSINESKQGFTRKNKDEKLFANTVLEKQTSNNNNDFFIAQQPMENQSPVQEESKDRRTGTMNSAKDYDAQHFKYANEGYTYQVNLYIRRIASDRHAQQIACKYPLFKMLRAISKKFFFNEIEIMFFNYILEENKWAINDERVRQTAFYMKDFLNITEIKEPLEYKSILLYLVLNAYAVKYYLNEPQDMEIFIQHLDSQIQDFKTLFQYWHKKYATTSLKINPIKLNKIYKKLSLKPTEQQKKVFEDYNALVDAIIQISPPYNNEKNDNQQQQMQQQQPQQIQQQNFTQNLQQVSQQTLLNFNQPTQQPNIIDNKQKDYDKNKDNNFFSDMNLSLQKKDSFSFMKQYVQDETNLGELNLLHQQQQSFKLTDDFDNNNKNYQQNSLNFSQLQIQQLLASQQFNLNNSCEQDRNNNIINALQQNMNDQQLQQHQQQQQQPSKIEFEQINQSIFLMPQSQQNNSSTQIKVPKTIRNQNKVQLIQQHPSQTLEKDEDLPQDLPNMKKLFSGSVFMNNSSNNDM